MKKNFAALILVVFIVFFASFSLVSAQDSGQPKNLLPDEADILQDGETLDCVRFMKLARVKVVGSTDPKGKNPTLREAVIQDAKITVTGIVFDKDSKRIDTSREVKARDAAMTCGFKSGRVPLWLVPFYIVRVIDFLLLVGGLVSVGFIVIGGYHMIIGGFSEEKEKGKNTIKYALIGLTLTLLAYTIVNLVLLFLTS